MRVAMLMGDMPWVESWARAAETQCDVIRIRFVARSAGGPWLTRTKSDPPEYAIRLPRRAGPYRVVGRLSDAPLARRFARAIRQIEEEHGRVDVIHAHFYSNARWLPDFQRLVRRPYVVTEHSTGWSGENPDNQITARGFKVALRAYRHAACVIPVSEDLRSTLVSRGVTGRLVVIPNPVDTELFHPTDAPSGNHPPRVVSVSRLAQAKGYPVLVEAVRHLVESGVELELEIVGDGPMRDELERLAGTLPPGVVSFLGSRNQLEVAEILRQADLFATATRVENLPVAVIEALATGLPVVGTDVNGMRELIDSPRVGMLVPRDDASALAAAIAQMLIELPDFDTRSANASHAKTRFSFQAVGNRLSSVYDSVVTN